MQETDLSLDCTRVYRVEQSEFCLWTERGMNKKIRSDKKEE